MNIVLNWSSGKDAALALHHLQQDSRYTVTGLLTTLSAPFRRVSMHGVREEILVAQAAAAGLPLQRVYLPEAADMQTYNNLMEQAVSALKRKGVQGMAFGDLFLEDLKKYRQAQLAAAGMEAVFPLWKKDTRELAGELEDVGIKARIVCVNERYLGKEFLGRTVDRELLRQLPSDVDPCGENGEFHTLVVEAPFFTAPLAVQAGEIVYKNYAGQDETWDTGFYFLDMTLI